MNLEVEMSDADLRTEVWRQRAEREIRQVLYDYCRGVDRLDRELMRSVYHDDAIDHHSTGFSGAGLDFADYVLDSFPARGYSTTSHQITQSRIELTKDLRAASVESYYTVAHSDEASIYWMLGRYLDRFECRDGTWKITNRLVVHDLNYRTEILEAFPPGTVTDGQQNRSDPSYAVLNW